MPARMWAMRRGPGANVVCCGAFLAARDLSAGRGRKAMRARALARAASTEYSRGASHRAGAHALARAMVALLS
jgi:hypothetical protein